MPYVDLPDVHLWYNDTGGIGVPVVLMHAASGTCESWSGNGIRRRHWCFRSAR